LPAIVKESKPAARSRPSASLQGDPRYLDRLTKENLEVGLAETASDRVMGPIKAADGRLNELKEALGTQNQTIAEDLATAYTMIVRRGIASLLQDRGEDAQALETARVVAKIYAGGNVKTLSGLEPEAQGTLKSAIHEALLATRE